MAEIQITIAKREIAPNADPLTLNINGTVLKCQDVLAEFALLELASAGSRTTDPADAAAAFGNFLSEVLEPDSFIEFRRMALAEKWTAEDMLPLVQRVVEEMAGRPTGPQSESDNGARPTGTPARVPSSSTGA